MRSRDRSSRVALSGWRILLRGSREVNVSLERWLWYSLPLSNVLTPLSLLTFRLFIQAHSPYCGLGAHLSFIVPLIRDPIEIDSAQTIQAGVL